MSGGWATKRWLVTGTSSGFGREIVRAVAQRGGRVLAAARRPQSVADLVEAGEGRVKPLALDVTDSAQIARVCAAASEDGGIDVLVNNAGYGFVGGVEESSDSEVREQMETNFFGAASLIRGVLPVMRAKRSGFIVNISSLAGICGFTTTGWYSASKFALEGLSESLAIEGADFNIHTLIVEPGAFNTNFGGVSLRRPANPLDVYPANNRHNASRDARDWSQTYDPALGVRAILKAMDSERPPLRLLLGAGATQTAEAAMLGRLAELRAWRSVASLEA